MQEDGPVAQMLGLLASRCGWIEAAQWLLMIALDKVPFKKRPRALLPLGAYMSLKQSLLQSWCLEVHSHVKAVAMKAGTHSFIHFFSINIYWSIPGGHSSGYGGTEMVPAAQEAYILTNNLEKHLEMSISQWNISSFSQWPLVNRPLIACVFMSFLLMNMCSEIYCSTSSLSIFYHSQFVFSQTVTPPWGSSGPSKSRKLVMRSGFFFNFKMKHHIL